MNIFSYYVASDLKLFPPAHDALCPGPPPMQICLQKVRHKSARRENIQQMYIFKTATVQYFYGSILLRDLKCKIRVAVA